MELSALSKPIEPENIEWKIQSWNKDKTKTTIVPYITSRCAMSRFDEAFGPLNWQIEFCEWRVKGVKAKLSVWNEDLKQWISREDGADQTDIEPTKGGFSDALKRVAVQFGLGRSLYDFPMIQLKGEFKYIPDWAFKQLNRIALDQNQGVNTRQYYELSDKPTVADKPAKPIATEPAKPDHPKSIIERIDEDYTGRLKAQLPEGLLDTIAGAVSREELLEIWDGNKQFHTNTELTAAITRAKNKLPEVQPSQDAIANPTINQKADYGIE